METPILTPMQQLAEKLIEMFEGEGQGLIDLSGIRKSIRERIKLHLPKEQEAIEEAYAMGSLNKTVQLLQGGTKIKATEYFNQTYKDNA